MEMIAAAALTISGILAFAITIAVLECRKMRMERDNFEDWWNQECDATHDLRAKIRALIDQDYPT